MKYLLTLILLIGLQSFGEGFGGGGATPSQLATKADTTYVDSSVNAEAVIRADQDDELRNIIASGQALSYEFYLATNIYTAGAFSYTPTNNQRLFCGTQTTSVQSFTYTYTATNTYGFVAFCTNNTFYTNAAGTAYFYDYASESGSGDITEKVELYAFVKGATNEVEIGDVAIPLQVTASSTPVMRIFNIPYAAYSNTNGYYLGIKKKCTAKGAGGTVTQWAGNGYNTHLDLALPSAILADFYVAKTAITQTVTTNATEIPSGAAVTGALATKVSNNNGISTNLTVSDTLTVSGFVVSVTATIGGTNAGDYAGVYSYLGTDVYYGQYFTNSAGRFLFTDTDSWIGGEYALGESVGSVVYGKSGSDWLNTLYEVVDITMTGTPSYGNVGGDITVSQGISSGPMRLGGGDKYFERAGLPSWNPGAGFVTIGNGEQPTVLGGAVGVFGGSTIIDVGLNLGFLSGFLDPSYASYSFRIDCRPDYEGFVIISSSDLDSEPYGHDVFKVNSVAVQSGVLPADFPFYKTAGVPGVTTNLIFSGTNVLNIQGGIITGVNK